MSPYCSVHLKFLLQILTAVLMYNAASQQVQLWLHFCYTPQTSFQQKAWFQLQIYLCIIVSTFEQLKRICIVIDGIETLTASNSGCVSVFCKCHVIPCKGLECFHFPGLFDASRQISNLNVSVGKRRGGICPGGAHQSIVLLLLQQPATHRHYTNHTHKI